VTEARPAGCYQPLLSLCDADKMLHRRCPYCKEAFIPSRYHPDQVVCSGPACQRRRRTEYHRQKLREDPAYRSQCRDSQCKWRQEHPDYMRTLRKKPGRTAARPASTEAVAFLDRLRKLVKNNVAIDLKHWPTAVWLLCPDTCVKNTLASAEVIVVEAVTHSAHAKLGCKEHLFGKYPRRSV
jgi:hypothetical protein